MTPKETLQAFVRQALVKYVGPEQGIPKEFQKISELIYWRGSQNEIRLSAMLHENKKVSYQIRCTYLEPIEKIEQEKAIEYLWKNKTQFAFKAFKSESPVCIKYDKLNRLYGRIERLYFRLNQQGKIVVDIEVKQPEDRMPLRRPAIYFADVYTYLKRKSNRNAEI